MRGIELLGVSKIPYKGVVQGSMDTCVEYGMYKYDVQNGSTQVFNVNYGFVYVIAVNGAYPTIPGLNACGFQIFNRSVGTSVFKIRHFNTNSSTGAKVFSEWRDL